MGWKCCDCHNTDLFVAIGSLPVSCVVGVNDNAIIDTSIIKAYPDPDFVEQCHICDSTNIKWTDQEEELTND
ncbi:hypothetical protein E3U55_08195 [Filobacillus milosensis]|uniref:Uncharacterized protein n=1 Tax=Filobacillus milosensis TaxID=94137 RepID=A0A4Y8IN58_9BACI|nr:hypothetical protein [Filobacillus milosensis]TFB21795.1 hypothetical protein E3U55_08195 [Filobacillus milosensis]